jgi:hypothetical protein
MVPDGEEEGAENPDNELEPSGRLWNYLISISSCFKDSEAVLRSESDICNQSKEQSGAKSSTITCTGDSSNGHDNQKENKSVNTVSLAAFVKAKGQYICRTA